MLSLENATTFLAILKGRFEKNMHRHSTILWTDILHKLEENTDKVWSLNQMEETDGEPDVVGQDEKSGEFLFYDCASESPKSRRSICYDHQALNSRKENKPRHSAVEMAKEMGVELLTESEYRHLQTLGKFDLKTSSWIKTPENIRKLGGAIFCDRRYETVFLYHNGAESYYAARGFRSSLRV